MEQLTMVEQTGLHGGQEMFNCAVAHHKACRYQEAIYHYMRALELEPHNAEIYYHCGLLLRDMGHLEKAMEYYQRTLEINPDHPGALYDLGIACFECGKYEEALVCNLRVIELKPDNYRAHTNLDITLATVGHQPEVTRACYRRMLGATPDIAAVGPRRIRLETSSSCNLRCQHCPTGTAYGRADRRVMSMDLFEKIAAQMQTMPILYDCTLYLGGEPLLNKNLAAMCRRVKAETGVRFTHFTTNAMLITEARCTELADADIDRIIVSVDGRSPAENDEIRSGARYQTIVDNVRLLKRYLQNTDIYISNIVIKRPGDPDSPVVPEFLQRDFAGLEIHTAYAMKWPGFTAANSALDHLHITEEHPELFCRMPFTDMAVKANGDIALCCYDLHGEHVMGNIHAQGLLDIWQGPAYKQLRNSMLDRNIAALPGICRKCKLYTGEMLALDQQSLLVQ